MNKKTKKGFTLVELLVVIAILAILATVSVVGYTSFIDKANQSVDEQFVTQLNTYLAAEEAADGKPENVLHVQEVLRQNGVKSFMATRTKNTLYWVKAENRIVIWTKDGSENGVSFPADYAEKFASVTAPTSGEWFILSSASEIFALGGTVEFPVDITVTNEDSSAMNVIENDVTVDFGNSTLKLDLPDATSATANWKGLDIRQGNVVLNAEEDGGIVTAPNGELYCIVVGSETNKTSANLTINGGTYIGGGTAVQVTQGTLTINGGSFKNADPKWTLNCKDAYYKNGTAKIIVNGGEFFEFDPSNNAAEGEGTNFVASGKTVRSEVRSDGTWYIVE